MRRVNIALCARCRIRRATFWQLCSVLGWLWIVNGMMSGDGFTWYWFRWFQGGFVATVAWQYVWTRPSMGPFRRVTRQVVDRLLLAMFWCPCTDRERVIVHLLVPLQGAAQAA